MFDLGLLSTSEPFEHLFCQGMINARAYRCTEHSWRAYDEVDFSDGPDKGTCKECGKPVEAEMAKMSKTKKNGVSPDELFEKHGADPLRMAILFMGSLLNK